VRVAWAPSLTRRLFRNRWLWIAIAVLVGVSGFSAVRQHQSELEAHAAAWGQQMSVVIVVDSVRLGESVAGGLVVARRPAAMVPAGAMLELPGPGSVAKADLFAGEVLLAARIADGESGVEGAGRRALTVAIEGPASLVEVGDLVDLWSIDARSAHAVEVATNVVVLDRDADDLTIAVPLEQVAAVAAAARQPITVALVG